MYVVPQICKDLLIKFASTNPVCLQYYAETNMFRIRYTSMKMHMFEDYFVLIPIGFDNQSIKIQKDNILSFWIPNKEN